jgi:hypothetical protein
LESRILSAGRSERWWAAVDSNHAPPFRTPSEPAAHRHCRRDRRIEWSRRSGGPRQSKPDGTALLSSVATCGSSYEPSASGFLPCHAVGCRIHSRRPPRSSHGDGPTASRSVGQTHHDVERSGRLLVDHAMIPYTVLGDALILRRDLTIGHLIDGQVELTLVADHRRAVIRPPEIPGAIHSEHFSRLTARPAATALVHQDPGGPALTIELGAHEDQRNQSSECAKSDQRQPARPIPRIGWNVMEVGGLRRSRAEMWWAAKDSNDQLRGTSEQWRRSVFWRSCQMLQT